MTRKKANPPKGGKENSLNPSEDSIRNDYKSQLDVLESLAEEVAFTLRQLVKGAGIKIHDVQARVKDISSVLKKIQDKNYGGIDRISDLVGSRVVCLFRSDLEKLQKLIEDNFKVLEVDSKFFNDPDAFGYMSIHYQCQLKQDCSGPRYDAIKHRSFEIQLRTICMHAWAAVSHYLDYKGEWDVPQELKKDLNALSALFFIADTQFEVVYASKRESETIAAESANSDEIQAEPINLDTMTAYLRARFPDRTESGPSYLSELIPELNAAGYKTIGDVSRDVERGLPALEVLEEKQSRRFMSVGVVRMALGMSSPAYRKLNYRDDDSDFTDYEHLVRKT